ncbi:hypothetical protein ACFFHM_01955 [Halalkalibacter kiskunsagensis]|uniref:Uncharacterized protein n=1 Tax=Halalkalibacter kiskunsagensis TaxID=1548599 RepID=A0ABV6K7P6_9BACI
MQRKRAIIGILIFAFVTILSYLLFHELFHLGEGLSVVFALVFGAIVEFMYQKRG